MSGTSDERNPVEVLADEFLARQRRGERPSLGDYTARYPDLADEIHELFPILLDMEDARPDAATPPGDVALPRGCQPAKLGDYRIVRELGRGGMGIVYEAEQESLGRRVALKVLARADLTPQQVRRFEREARSAARLHHTNIVPVFGVGHEGGTHYYVMQYIPGQPLDEVLKELRRLRRRGERPVAVVTGPSDDRSGERPSAAELARSLRGERLASSQSDAPDLFQTADAAATTLAEAEAIAPSAPSTVGAQLRTDSEILSASADLTSSGRRYALAVARIGVQVAEALEYAADQGIIHRDIKPSNVLLDLTGTAWVTDFGLAKVAGLEDLTHTGDLVGTLRYMAPERFRGVTDRRGDVFALGLTLYELLALRPAYDGSERASLVRQLAEVDPPRLSKIDPTIPRDLATVVQKAMAREPADRYATSGALAFDLLRFLEDRPIVARRPSLFDRVAKWSRRHRAAVGAGTVGLVLALAILAGSLGWIARDRAARSELTEREVNRALAEAATLQRRAKWPEVLEAVKRAEGFLAVGASEQLRQRVDERRTDADIVLRLEENRQPRPVKLVEGAYEGLGWDAEYTAAFRDCGIDVFALDPAVAGGLIRGRSIRRELTSALDHWVDLLKRHRSSDEASWKRLIAVARAADPDGWRNRLRDALEDGDRAKANKLAESAAVDDLPVQTLELLLLTNMDNQHRASVLRRAQRQHPDDYWINFKLAYGLDYVAPPIQDQDEAIRFYTAAIACRPRNAPAHFYLAHVLYQRGRADEAIIEYQKSIELDPDFTWPRTGLCTIYLNQGKFDLAISESEHLVERNSRDAAAHALLGDAFRLRGRTCESIREYETAIALEPSAADFQNNLAWTLATCPEKRLRNASRALTLAMSAVERAKNTAPCWNTLGVALYRNEKWKDAIAALEKSISIQGYSSYDGFFLAIARVRLGEPEKARGEFDRAVRWMHQVKPKNDELRRFRAEAAELLELDDRLPAVSQ